MPSKFAYIDGTAVHYVHAGRSTLPGVVPDLSRGELLVFVHDAGGNAASWRQVTALLDAEHSTVAFDFPAHGRSGSTEGFTTIAEYGAFLVAFVRALGACTPILVGHGMGGAAALQAAVHGLPVRALVLVGAADRFDVPGGTLQSWHDVMRGRAAQPFTTEGFSSKTDFSVMREAWMEQPKTDPRVRYFDLAACAAYELETAALAVPTLIVAGEDDVVAPPSAAARLQAAMPTATLKTIAAAGHLLPFEQPAALAAAITAFLADLPDMSDESDRSSS